MLENELARTLRDKKSAFLKRKELITGWSKDGRNALS